ncbi:MAG: hypothetical protein FRX49_08632 [Trebouxia sp. A1-2]|nr:MAG: hypothetical protein FRX49_08632 [Trebouxia sp. A1-2]
MSAGIVFLMLPGSLTWTCCLAGREAGLMNSKQATAKEGWFVKKVMMHKIQSGASCSSMISHLNKAC